MVRTRFAPSPTGYLHPGNVRVALFNWLFARTKGGEFVLRIEDTDRVRSTRAFEYSILEDLRWFGLEWDEGPYRQSERLAIYQDYAERFLKEGKAYRCYCTPERLEDLRKTQLSAGWVSRYDGRCRRLSDAERRGLEGQGIVPSIRFIVPSKVVTIKDLIKGEVVFDATTFGDFIIIGSDGIATYNFAVVVDDALMGINHVIRGEDHLSNTPRQILLFEALGLPIPQYAHIPLILGPDRTPLSKRHGVASVRELREEGFLPEAILNYLAHLGWTPRKDYLSLREMVGEFSLDRLSKAPAIFDMERLKGFNRDCIKGLDLNRLLPLVMPYLERGYDLAGWTPEGLSMAVEAVKGDMVTLNDAPELLRPIFTEPLPDKEAEIVLKEGYARGVISLLSEEIEKVDRLTADTYSRVMRDLQERIGLKGGRLFMPIRAALTGTTKGIELEKVFQLLGKERVLGRLRRYLYTATWQPRD